MRPVFDIAKADKVDPFDDTSALSIIAKKTMRDFDYPEQVLFLQRLHDEERLSPLQLQDVVRHKLFQTIGQHPFAYFRIVIKNNDPSSYGALLYNPLFTLNDFFQLCVPPYERIIPGTGLKSFRSLLNTRNWTGLALAFLSCVTLVGSTGLFLLMLVGLPWAAATQRWSQELSLGLKALGVFLIVAISFSLIHTEARHIMPVIPEGLIATAIFVAERLKKRHFQIGFPKPGSP